MIGPPVGIAEAEPEPEPTKAEQRDDIRTEGDPVEAKRALIYLCARIRLAIANCAVTDLLPVPPWILRRSAE